MNELWQCLSGHSPYTCWALSVLVSQYLRSLHFHLHTIPDKWRDTIRSSTVPGEPFILPSKNRGFLLVLHLNILQKFVHTHTHINSHLSLWGMVDSVGLLHSSWPWAKSAVLATYAAQLLPQPHIQGPSARLSACYRYVRFVQLISQYWQHQMAVWILTRLDTKAL